MRGDHYGMAWRVLDAQGSSPHARRPRPADAGALLSMGIIPACAGTTLVQGIPDCLSWDHYSYLSAKFPAGMVLAGIAPALRRCAKKRCIFGTTGSTN